MRIGRIATYTFILIASATLWAAIADSPSLSGIARDGAGKPLVGVRITLTSSENASLAFQTTSDSSGEYRFVGLAAGKYALTAELSGYAPTEPLAVLVVSALSPLTVSLTLERSSFTQGADAQTASYPRLEFQSAGIRGVIDPGGYSASTSSAASGLLRGIADMKRTDRRSYKADSKDWPCALEPELREAVSEHPEKEETIRRLGQFYAAHGQPARAIPLFKRALQINVSDAVALRELAVALMQDGQFGDARRVLLPLVNPAAGADLHQLLARADEGSEMFQLAAQEYREAESKEQSEESIFGEGYELVLAGSIAEGMNVFAAGIQMYPRSIPLRIGAGTAQCLLGRTSDGLRNFLDATDIDPADPRPYSFLASASGNSSDESDRVRKSFMRFLDRAPNSGSASYFLALALSRGNPASDTDRIQVLLQRAIQLDPNLAKAHLLLAEIYAGHNDYEQAVPEFEAALRLAQDMSEAHYRLALAYKNTGRSEQAAREMEIFRLSKKSKASGSDAESIDIAQFISVMDTPGQPFRPETQCPATASRQESAP
jgi:tetratricopeptide (TPR) repeat protein